MSELNAPKNTGAAVNLALIVSAAAALLTILNTFVIPPGFGYIFGPIFGLLVPLVSLAATVFAGLKQFIVSAVASGFLAFVSLLVSLRDLTGRDWYYYGWGPGVPFIHFVLLAASVLATILALRARSGSATVAVGAGNSSSGQGTIEPGPSDRKWVTALLLSLFFGLLGFDRLYVGRTGLAIAKLLTAGGLGVWALVDFIMLCVGKMPDVHGRPLQR